MHPVVIFIHHIDKASTIDGNIRRCIEFPIFSAGDTPLRDKFSFSIMLLNSAVERIGYVNKIIRINKNPFRTPEFSIIPARLSP